MGIAQPTARAEAHGGTGASAPKNPLRTTSMPAEMPVSSHPGLVSTSASSRPRAAAARIQSDAILVSTRLKVFTREVRMLYPLGMTSTISTKGQITVPKGVRDALGLRPGTRVEFELTADGAVLRKGHRAGIRAVDRVLGILKREAPTDSLIDDMRGSVPSSFQRRG